MRRPDIRQRVIEAVSTWPRRPASTTSLIAALALHRRMTESELRHAVARVYDAFAPRGLLYNHERQKARCMAFLGETGAGRGRDQQAGAESDLLI